MSLFAGSDYSAPGAFPAHRGRPYIPVSRLPTSWGQNSNRAPNW